MNKSINKATALLRAAGLKNIKTQTYSVIQLAKVLGVSRHTIYRMRDNCELPPVLPMQRRLTRWKIEDIDLWFEMGCPNTKNFVRYKKDMQRFARHGKHRPKKNGGDQ